LSSRSHQREGFASHAETGNHDLNTGYESWRVSHYNERHGEKPIPKRRVVALDQGLVVSLEGRDGAAEINAG
jgi:hypothetical protein